MGPLPPLHTLIVVSVILALCLAAGVWLADNLQLPLGGVGVGLGAGALLAFVVTRDFRGTSRRRQTR